MTRWFIEVPATLTFPSDTDEETLQTVSKKFAMRALGEDDEGIGAVFTYGRASESVVDVSLTTTLDYRTEVDAVTHGGRYLLTNAKEALNFDPSVKLRVDLNDVRATALPEGPTEEVTPESKLVTGGWRPPPEDD